MQRGVRKVIECLATGFTTVTLTFNLSSACSYSVLSKSNNRMVFAMRANKSIFMLLLLNFINRSNWKCHSLGSGLQKVDKFSLTPRPFRLSMVQHRHRRHMPPSAQQMADPVRIFIQYPVVPVLRILSPGVHMRRAVRVRERLRRERMGDEMVHSPHQHMVRHPFHQLQALRPAVSPEHLRHRPRAWPSPAEWLPAARSHKFLLLAEVFAAASTHH